MPFSLSQSHLRSGVAAVCLLLAQFSHTACSRDRAETASEPAGTWLLLPSPATDSLLGARAGPIYAAMGGQIARLRERGLAAWALLDSLGSSSTQAPSSSLRGLSVFLARFDLETTARGVLDQATLKLSDGPAPVEGAITDATFNATAWDEGGKIGMMTELRATMTTVENGAPVKMELRQTERIEVKFCPDVQGLSPGTRELIATLETLASANPVDRGDFRATGVLAGQVDDEAELTRVHEEMETKVRESSGSASRDLTPVLRSSDGAARGTPTSIDSWAGSEWQFEAPNDGVRDQLKRAANMISRSTEMAYARARDRWQHDHRCIEVAFLEGNKRSSVSPADRVRIVAEARHKEDGGKLPAPLEASILAYQSITPDGKRIPPPAEFIYQAPESGTKEAEFMRKSGTTVWVTSTSRRGIGQGVIEYKLGSGPSYQVKMQVRQEAEKLGTTYDVTYEAKLEPGPDGELQGSGSYRGTELSWKVACSDVDQDPNAETHPVSGKLKATGSAVDMGGSTMLMFSLETQDFPPPAGWSGEVDPETKGRGTVGNLGLSLTGPVTSKTVKGEGDLMGFSSETPCTGKFSNTQETTVQIVQ